MVPSSLQSYLFYLLKTIPLDILFIWYKTEMPFFNPFSVYGTNVDIQAIVGAESPTSTRTEVNPLCSERKSERSLSVQSYLYV